MSRRPAGNKMLVTVTITPSPSGLFFARSKDAKSFLASHSDENVLRQMLPMMVKDWAQANGHPNVTVKVLPPRESASSRAPAYIRMSLEYCAA